MHSYNHDNQKFKNTPSRVFFEYFYSKLKNGELERGLFFERMGVGISVANQMQFFTGLRNGHKSVTIDHIQAAWEHYQVTPNYLFGLSAEPMSMAAEPEQVYNLDLRKDLVKLRKTIDDIERKLDNK